MLSLVTLGTSHGDPTPTRFNTSTLLAVDGAGYLVDAGAPVNALLIRHGTAFASLRALFVTHMHEDHVGGIPGLVKSCVKYPVPGQRLTIHLPEAGAREAVLAFMRATHCAWDDALLGFADVAAGPVYVDDRVRATAFATRHGENGGPGFPTFGYTFEAEGERVVFTGDLREDFSDFPCAELAKPAHVVCESTHFPLEPALERLAALPIRSLILTHVGDRWQTPEGERRFTALAAALPFPAALARDGDTFPLTTAKGLR